MKIIISLVTLLLLLPTVAWSEEPTSTPLGHACVDHFTREGSLTTGMAWRTHAEFPSVSADAAFDRVVAALTADGWRIGTLDRKAGIINATQDVEGGDGKTSPLGVVIKPQGGGSRVEIVFRTGMGVAAPPSSVAASFCKTLTAVDGSSFVPTTLPEAFRPADLERAGQLSVGGGFSGLNLAAVGRYHVSQELAVQASVGLYAATAPRLSGSVLKVQTLPQSTLPSTVSWLWGGGAGVMLVGPYQVPIATATTGVQLQTPRGFDVESDLSLDRWMGQSTVTDQLGHTHIALALWLRYRL